MNFKKLFTFRRQPLLLLMFFTCMFVFASLSRKDITNIKEFNRSLLSKVKPSKSPSLKETKNKAGKATISSFSGNASAVNTSAPVKNSLTDAAPLMAFSPQEKLHSAAFNPLYSDTVEQIFESVEKQGQIGVLSEKEEDRISDNFFTIRIPKQNTVVSSAYLSYELYGLANHQSVSRSINHNPALGGDVIVSGYHWSVQKEAINLQLLKEGENTVMFTAPSPGIKYKVKNVKIVFENGKAAENISISSLQSSNTVYLKGFIRNAAPHQSEILVAGEAVRINNGEFEKTLTVTSAFRNEGINIQSGNSSFRYKVPPADGDLKVLHEESFRANTLTVLKDQQYQFSHDGATLLIEKESTASEAVVQILRLREKDFPTTNQGIKNLTPEAKAFRITIPSGKLQKKIKVTLPYDEKKLGAISSKEIKSFYFDYQIRKWKLIDNATADEKTKTVSFEAIGEGDYINGIISVPESPQLNAFAPTSISGLKAADPTARLQFISPPSGSQKGDANISYPIVIPSGRNGMQPNLSFNYSSDGGNGWLGEGWSIGGLSSINIDTRWGAPAFDPTKESELYSLDGETLVYEGNYMPNRHNVDGTNQPTTTPQPRNSVSNEKSFYLRKGHNFSIIKRYGTTPDTYRWIVTSTDGTKYYYGGDENGINIKSVLKTNDGAISSWGLWKAVDTHNNNIIYYYDNDAINFSGNNANLSGGKSFNVKSVTYTGAGSADGAYKIDFIKENTVTRKDLSIDGKRGLKYIEPYRLKTIEIKERLNCSPIDQSCGSLFRSYRLEYIEGEFGKSLLSKIKQPYEDDYITVYNFDYHNELKDGNTELPIFGPDVSISTDPTNLSFPILPSAINPSKINSTYTKEEGGTIRASFLMDVAVPTQNPYGNLILFSKTFGASTSEARTARQIVDFNGDGIPDYIYKKSDGLFLKSGYINQQGYLNFNSNITPIQNFNSNFSFTKTELKSNGTDFGGGVDVFIFNLFLNSSTVNSSSTSITPTYLRDANSDGLMDIVHEGKVYFNKIENGAPSFTQFSEFTENMLIKAEPIAPIFEEQLPKDDVIKMWIAPRAGYIRFHDDISIEQVPNANAVYSVEINTEDGSGSYYGRLYLTKLINGTATQSQTIDIKRYNDYFSQIQSMPPTNTQFNHMGIDQPSGIRVESGDKIFVRLRQDDNKNYKVFSNPEIVYVNKFGVDIPNDPVLDQDGFNLNNGSYAENFLLNDADQGIKLPNNGTVSITVPTISFPSLTDKVTFTIKSYNLINNTEVTLYTHDFLPSINPSFPVSLSGFTLNSIAITAPTVIKVYVDSDSHTAFKNSGLDNISLNYATGGNNYTLNPIPKYPSRFITGLRPKINISHYTASYPQGSHVYGVEINKNTASSTFTNAFTFKYIVKKNGKVLAKREVTVSSPVSGSFQTIERDLNSGQIITGIQPITFYSGVLNGNDDEKINIQVYFGSAEDRIHYGQLASLFNGKLFNIYYDGSAYLTSVPETSINSTGYNYFTKFYNNWGQFLYNDINKETDFDYMRDEYGALANLFPEIDMSLNFDHCTGLNDENEIKACIIQTSSNYSLPAHLNPLWVLKSNGIEKWKGIGLEQYAMADSFKDDISTAGLFNTQGFGVDPANPDETTLVPGLEATKMKAINKINLSSSKTKTLSGSLSAAGISAGIGDTEVRLTGPGSVSSQDFMDLNGDGYPDIVTKSSLQLTNATGGLRSYQSPFADSYISNSDSYINASSVSLSFDVKQYNTLASYIKYGITNTTAKADTSSPWAAPVGLNANFNYDSKDSGNYYWMDLNGDGLADRIAKDDTTSEMKYQLNFGKQLSTVSESFFNLETYSSRPKNSVGISIGTALSGLANIVQAIPLNIGINASAGGTISEGSSEKTFEDVNGDGMIDLITVVNTNKTMVSYNLGNKFADPIDLKKGTASQIDFANELKNYNGYASIGGHVYIPFLVIPVWPPLNIYLKAGIDASYNLGLTISEVNKSFMDMNGDGYNDLVRSDGNQITVNYSKIGKTNKLKTVTNEKSKAAFAIDYEFTKPNYEDPHARLVMKEVKVFNPDILSTSYTNSTPGKDVITRFKYVDTNNNNTAKYDRRERLFLGFKNVTTEELDETGTVYRKNKQTFYNKSYHTAGLLRTNELMTGAGTLLSKDSTNYALYRFINNNTEIEAIDPSNFETFDAGGKEGRRMGVALASSSTNTTYENGSSITTTSNLKYNVKGQLKNYAYSSPSTSYNTEITYHSGLQNNILNAPKTVTVYPGSTMGTPLRFRETSVNNFGDITQVRVKLNSSEFAVTDMLYDGFGNIIKITYPENENGQRYFLNYTYSPQYYSKYVTEITDYFGATSSAEYDTQVDLPTKTIDVTGNETLYNYDQYGRANWIRGPKEALTIAPSVEYRYGMMPWKPNSNIYIYVAATLNYDPEHPQNRIETITIADGFGKVAQVKKDVAMFGTERMSISGITNYDHFGRAVKQYHPSFELKHTAQYYNIFTLNHTFNFDLNPVSTTNIYDEKDRVIKAIDEDSQITDINFEIDNSLFKKSVVIYNSTGVLKNETLSNAEGKVVRSSDFIGNYPNSTNFEYNTLGELTTTYDPENIATEYQYDLAGRRTSMLHPDHGESLYLYDTAGHLIRYFSANLMNNPLSAEYIKYEYDFNRLTAIVLPDVPTGPNPNNVSYEYGGSNDGNNATRLVYKRDGTGETYFEYGDMGEVVNIYRTIQGIGMPNHNFATHFEYDTWNRIKIIDYPDGEHLIYSYDVGGNLKKIMNEDGYEYVKSIIYDTYGQRKSITYGNDITSQYSYTEKKRRLNMHTLSGTGNNALLQNQYTYDTVGNIKTLNNTAQQSPNTMGGYYENEYTYDSLNRLIDAKGKFNITEDIPEIEGDPVTYTHGTSPYQVSNSEYFLNLEYNASSGILKKHQNHLQDQIVNEENTYINHYTYEDGTHKLQSVADPNTGNEDIFEYDYNGNVLTQSNTNGSYQKLMYWDEQDRMKAFYDWDAGIFQYYTYDDAGERTIKYTLEEGAQLYQNGELIDDSFNMRDYKLYPNPYLVVTSDGRYTKHYFDGSTRIASRVADGADMYQRPSGKEKNTERKAPDPSADLKTYLNKAGLGEAKISAEFARAPAPTSDLYYLHGDHLGTATFVTDGNGETTQFFLNLPFGETMAEQNLPGAYENPYKFNAKELDVETNLYYYGARYYNPKFSIWYGVDPLAVYNPVMETEFYGDWQHNGGVGFWGNNNPYIYTYQNPIIYVDPNGKQTKGSQETKYKNTVFQQWVADNVSGPLSSYMYENVTVPVTAWTDKNIRQPVTNATQPLRDAFTLDPESAVQYSDLQEQMGQYMSENVGGAYRAGAEYGLAGSGMGMGHIGAYSGNLLKLGKSISSIMGKSYKSVAEVTVEIKNTGLLKQLNKSSKGNWVKVYEAGIKNGRKVEMHYFRNNKNNKVYDVKQKYQHWHQKQFKKIK
ncbi:MAG: hypothetical protein K0M56_04030 [Kaistella sp.]|nr:hypothetical protein [Kaistella sp.]